MSLPETSGEHPKRPIRIITPRINGSNLPVSHTPSIGGERAQKGYFDLAARNNGAKKDEGAQDPTPEP